MTVTLPPRPVVTSTVPFNQAAALGSYQAIIGDITALDNSGGTGPSAALQFEALARHLASLEGTTAPPGLDPPSWFGRVASLRLFADAASAEALAASPQAPARYGVIRSEVGVLLAMVNGALRTNLVLPVPPATTKNHDDLRTLSEAALNRTGSGVILPPADFTEEISFQDPFPGSGRSDCRVRRSPRPSPGPRGGRPLDRPQRRQRTRRRGSRRLGALLDDRQPRPVRDLLRPHRRRPGHRCGRSHPQRASGHPTDRSSCRWRLPSRAAPATASRSRPRSPRRSPRPLRSST